MKDTFGEILKCEDHWMDNWVFIAGFGTENRKSSMMAYGTIIDHKAFDTAWESIKDKYSDSEWEEICEYWVYQHYLSPMPVLLVMAIYRKLGLSYEMVDGKFVRENNP